MLIQIGYLVGGLVLLGIGAKLLVDGATQVAVALGVSQLVIGLTVVAIGTSLPEMVTSVVASYRGQRDIAVGNIVGSNLFNLLCVLGLTAAVSPTPVPVSATAIHFDFPVMLLVAFACFPVFATGNLVKRWEGSVFLLYYIVYTAILVGAAAAAPWSTTLEEVTMYGLLPLTLIAVTASILKTRKVSAASE